MVGTSRDFAENKPTEAKKASTLYTASAKGGRVWRGGVGGQGGGREEGQHRKRRHLLPAAPKEEEKKKEHQ